MLTNSPWQNPADPVDVNNDGEFSAIDILVVLNHIEVHSEGSVSEDDYGAPLFPDVNGDLNVTPIDALLQMNYLNALEAGLPNPGLSASSMPGSSSSSASSSSREESDYATMMTASGGPSEPSCPLDYLPPSIDVWFRDAATGDVIDYVVEGQRFLLDTRVLESLPCPSGMIGDRVGWDIDWGDGTTTSTNGTGPVVSGHQAAFGHVYLDDNPTDTPSDIYHITVTGSDKDGTGVLPISFLVKNVAPKVTITSITPIDSVPEEKGGVNGRLDETEGFVVKGTVTDPGVLDTFPVANLEVDLNFDGDTADEGESVSVALMPVPNTPGRWTFNQTVGTVSDDGTSPGNDTSEDPMTVTVNVEDDDTGNGSASSNVTVYNVAPKFVDDPNVVGDEPRVSFEFDAQLRLIAATVIGSFTDPGMLDEHRVSIEWGDGEVGDGLVNPVPLLLGERSFSITRYFDAALNIASADLQPLLITVIDDDLGDDTVELHFGCACSCTSGPGVFGESPAVANSTQSSSSSGAIVPLIFGPVLVQTGYAGFSEPRPLAAGWTVIFQFASGVAGDILHQRVTATAKSFDGNGQPVGKMYVSADDLKVLANSGGAVAVGDNIDLAAINDWAASQLAKPEVCKITLNASGKSQIGPDASVFPVEGSQFVPYDPAVHGQGQVATTVIETVYINGTPLEIELPVAPPPAVELAAGSGSTLSFGEIAWTQEATLTKDANGRWSRTWKVTWTLPNGTQVVGAPTTLDRSS